PLLAATPDVSPQPEHVISKPATTRGVETQNTKHGGGETRNGAEGVPAEQGWRRLVRGTLLLSFVLICMLLVVGLAGAVREWGVGVAGRGGVRGGGGAGGCGGEGMGALELGCTRCGFACGMDFPLLFQYT